MNGNIPLPRLLRILSTTTPVAEQDERRLHLAKELSGILRDAGAPERILLALPGAVARALKKALPAIVMVKPPPLLVAPITRKDVRRSLAAWGVRWDPIKGAFTDLEGDTLSEDEIHSIIALNLRSDWPRIWKDLHLAALYYWLCQMDPKNPTAEKVARHLTNMLESANRPDQMSILQNKLPSILKAYMGSKEGAEAIAWIKQIEWERNAYEQDLHERRHTDLPPLLESLLLELKTL